jgi:hypothetical protein
MYSWSIFINYVKGLNNVVKSFDKSSTIITQAQKDSKPADQNAKY